MTTPAERRAEAATRVAALHPPLGTLFAALRAELDAPPAGRRKPSDALARLGAVLAANDAGDAGDADDLALRLAVAVEDVVDAAARAGVGAARVAGVPGDDEVPHDALDVVIAALQPVAAQAIAAGPDGVRVGEPLVDRLRGLARSAGVVAAVRGVPGWALTQRYGAAPCPRAACAGRDGRVVEPTDADLPPYDETCTCRVDPARVH